MIPSVVVAAALYQLIIKLALEFRKEQLYQIIAVSSTYVICNPCTVQTLTINLSFCYINCRHQCHTDRTINSLAITLIIAELVVACTDDS